MTTIVFKNKAVTSAEPVFGIVKEYINEFFSLMPEGVNGVETIDDLLGPSAVLGEILTAFQNGGGRIVSFFSFLMLSAIVAYLASIYAGRLSPLAEAAASIYQYKTATYG